MSFAPPEYYSEEEFYNLPDDVRAELMDGQIYYQATPDHIHQTILSELYTAIGNYITSKGGSCRVYSGPFAVKLFRDRRTIVRPDISVLCDSEMLTERGCTGAPDWIVEIVSPSSPVHDYVRKLKLYVDAGVREYWIVDPHNRTILVYHLEQSDFTVEMYSFRDKVEVRIYDDLWIDFSGLDI